VSRLQHAMRHLAKARKHRPGIGKIPLDLEVTLTILELGPGSHLRKVDEFGVRSTNGEKVTYVYVESVDDQSGENVKQPDVNEARNNL